MLQSFKQFLSLKEGDVVPQQELAQNFSKGKQMMFIKNTPVALIPTAQLSSIANPQQVQHIMQMVGGVDVTSYSDAFKQKGYIVFQWDSKNNKPDIYIADPNSVVQKYTRFQGEMPPNPQKVPSLVALKHLGIDPSKVPFFVKKVPTRMIRASDLGLEGKTIQTSWGTQQVAPGGYLAQEDNGHVYTVAPDQRGLPIGYIPAS